MFGLLLMTASSIAIARTAGPETFGKYGVITAYFAIALVPMSAGVSNLLIRVIASNSQFDMADYRDAFKRMQTASLLISFVFVLIILFSFWRQLDAFDIVQLGVSVWLSQLTALHLSVLRGLGKPHWAIIADQVIKPVVLITAVYLFVLFGETRVNLHFLIFAFTISSVIGYFYARKMLYGLPLKLVNNKSCSTSERSIFSWKNKELIYLCIVSFAYALNSSIEIFFLDWQGKHALIGQFKVFVQVATMSGLVYVSVNYLAVERFSRLSSNEIFAKSRDSQVLAGISLLGACFIPITLSFAGTDVLSMLFGSDYSFYGSALWILLLAQILNGLFGMSNSLLISRGKTKVAMWLMLLILFLKMISVPYLVIEFGLEGAAWASFAGLVIYKLLVWGYCMLRFGLDTSVFALHLKHIQGQGD